MTARMPSMPVQAGCYFKAGQCCARCIGRVGGFADVDVTR